MNIDYDDLNEYIAYNRSNERAKLWTGIAIGVGVGVLIGLLLAPRSGQETIHLLTDNTDNLKRQLNDLVDKAGQTATAYAEKGKDFASKLSPKA